MGIPYYYRQVVLRDQKTLLADLHECDQLFLDYNSIIHQCAAVVIGKKITVDLEQTIFEEIFNYTIMLTKICKPKELLYLGVDGVAPRSKINQQRRRRYISAYRNEIVNKFKDQNGIKYVLWDSNVITPGTEFMIKLDNFLKNKISTFQANFKIVLSGHTEKGEGEHKIFNYIKNTPDKVNVVYGLDADLIMLSLCSPCDQLYLMRESNNFINGASNTEFKFLNIRPFRRSVCHYTSSEFDINALRDYVCVCFFLGNDFVPNISCLKIKAGAIDLLCDMYKKVYKKLQTYLVIKSNDKYTINQEFLVDFLELLASKEDVLMKETTTQFYHQATPIRTQFSCKLDKFSYDLENYPSINKFPLLINPLEDTTWKTSYYHHLFGSHTHDMIKNITESYISGLNWITDYYFNGIINNSWYYKYSYAPCVADIYKYIRTDGIVRTETSESIEITEVQQLLMVLPPFSKSILDPKFHKIMEEVEYGCVHYYPVKFCLTSYLKTHLWECIPVLPNIELEKINVAYSKCTTK